jgi:hypothetical protein
MKALIIPILAILLIACNKRSSEHFVVVGQITDSEQGFSLGNVKIDIYQVTSSGGSSGTTLLETVYSENDGTYSVTFDRNLVEEYIITYTKDGYFTETVTRNFDDMKTSEDNVINLAHRPIGWITFVIKNIPATDPSDQMKIYKESGAEFCPDCCPGGFYYFDGAQVDTTWTCANVAGTMFEFRLFDLNGPVNGHDSILTIQGDTVFYPINY